MQRVLGGDPPGAAQFNPGREYEELIKNNLLLDLTDARQGRQLGQDHPSAGDRRPPAIVDGHWWCVPVNIHSWNWAWVSIPAFKKAGLACPRTSTSSSPTLPKLKAAGIIPFAIGGDGGGWQIAGAFGVIQTAELGHANREKLLQGQGPDRRRWARDEEGA